MFFKSPQTSRISIEFDIDGTIDIKRILFLNTDFLCNDKHSYDDYIRTKMNNSSAYSDSSRCHYVRKKLILHNLEENFRSGMLRYNMSFHNDMLWEQPTLRSAIDDTLQIFLHI